MDLDVGDVGLRLGAAAFAGAVIGVNRDLAKKPIGMRTLGLVALGAATVAVAATTVPGMMENADAMSRVVQGIVQGIMAGISFIGAGVILRDARARTVEGLTTAASVWVTAAVGIACGLGAWSVVMIGTAFTLMLLVLVGQIESLYALKREAKAHPRDDNDLGRLRETEGAAPPGTAGGA
jgi:putative Mg2+ transporter-C (MgtC) family protein